MMRQLCCRWASQQRPTIRPSSHLMAASAYGTYDAHFRPNSSSSSLAQQLLTLCDVIRRSSTARAQLCESIHEASPEVALLMLDRFAQDERVWKRQSFRDALTQAHAAPHSTWDQVQLVLLRFRQWYYATQAAEKTQLHNPWDWYPLARYTFRRFHFHCGPTNSGKTHAALAALAAARSGVYCAPLKALAGQVWRQMNDDRNPLGARVPCDLLIGDERRFAGGAEHVSCTVEMTPIDTQVDVAVIDEVQMIADPERGWAWTRALLGLPAREIHLCGEARTIPLVKQLLYKTKELHRLRVVDHQRLVPLQVSDSLHGDYRQAENGDCFVCFSYKSIMHVKEKLERLHQQMGENIVVSYIYGGMPFEVREEQAKRFNEGVEAYVQQNGQAVGGGKPFASVAKHVLVATDAIAFGLNMNIERVIFTTMRKFSFVPPSPVTQEDATGKSSNSKGSMITLSPATIQQISGRAGRFGLVRQHAVGRCTTLYDTARPTPSGKSDFVLLQEAMLYQQQPQQGQKEGRRPGTCVMELPPITRAGLLPTLDILLLHMELCQLQALKTLKQQQQNGAEKTPIIATIDEIGEPDPVLVTRWAEAYFERLAAHSAVEEAASPSSSSSLFFACDATRSVLRIIKAIESVPAMRLSDRLLFSFLPLNDSTEAGLHLLQLYAADHAAGRPVVLRIDAELQQLLLSSRPSPHRQQQQGDTMQALSAIYKRAEMYNWLAWRFRETFVHMEEAQQVKRQCVAAMKQIAS